MLFTLGVTALWTATQATHGSSLPIAAFAVTGYSSVLLWRNMPGRCSGAIGPNLALMYHRNVRVIDIYLSRIILEVVGTTISFATLTLFFHAIGWMELPEDILKVVAGWFSLIWFGASLGLTVGALSERSEIVEKLWHPMSYLLFPLSGAAFMVDWLPAGAQQFVLLLPMVHGVELLREGFFGSQVNAHYSMAYMSVCSLCLTLIGLSQERVVSRKVMPE